MDLFFNSSKTKYLTVNVEVDRFQVTTNSIEFLILECYNAEEIKVGFLYGCIENIAFCALKFKIRKTPNTDTFPVVVVK